MTTRRLYFFAYDVSDERRRRRLRRVLQAYAVGGQKSLFECLLTEAELQELCKMLPPFLEEKDRLQVALLPENGLKACFGCAKPLTYEFFMVV